MHFLEDLLEPMGRRERRHWARIYVQGLLLDGERKSIEPMASRIEGADVQALRQFVGQSPWAVEEVQRRLAHKVVDLLSEAEVWIIDETSFPKAGRHSVGVARQYCGTLGKIANCQVAVSLHWSSAQASCPLVCDSICPSSGSKTARGLRKSSCQRVSLIGARPSWRWRQSTRPWPGSCRRCRCWPIRPMAMTSVSARPCASASSNMRFRLSRLQWCGLQTRTCLCPHHGGKTTWALSSEG
jgi:DDE superfamily endonuclease